MKNRWIPVSERMPEEHDSIFARLKGTSKWNEAMFERTSYKVICRRNSFDENSAHGRWKMEINTSNFQWYRYRLAAISGSIQGKLKKHRLFIGAFYKILENSNDQIVKTPVLLFGNLLKLFFKLYRERDVSSGLIRLDGHVKSLPCF